jgi:hypothetical protein
LLQATVAGEQWYARAIHHRNRYGDSFDVGRRHGSDSTVQLQHEGGKLESAFKARKGSSFRVSLTKQ